MKRTPARNPARLKLPIGIQSFRRLREGGHHYVDKTADIARLVDEGSAYFLSRPRRFGKSLLVDTLRHLFEGREVLFRDLAIHGRWDWSKPHPVLKIDFAGGDFSTPERLEAEAIAQLDDQVRAAGVDPGTGSASTRLSRAVRALRAQSGGRRVAVLVDEYDKPILDHLGTPAARANRDVLSGFYATLKACDDDLRFVLLTGVSRFSKVNLFSGLNNLEDITLDPRFATMCGYTEAELDRVFASELEGLDRARIREWYNGYRWLGEPVYNPFDLLLLLRRRKFAPYWFETGTPAFLLDLLARRGVTSFELEGIEADESLLSAFEVDAIEPEALLFQAGYLTIRKVVEENGEDFYRLDYPNLEVRRSLNRHLLRFLTGRSAAKSPPWRRLARALRNRDLTAIQSQLRSLFAGIPHQWHTRNELARYEGYYASVLYSFLAGTGLDVRVEDSSAAGRVDMAVLLEEDAYLFELKVAERASAGAALAQLRERGYAEKFRTPGRRIHLVGIHFSEETRSVVEFEFAAG